MILCKDCRHYSENTSIYTDRCMFNANIDLVRGELYSDLLCISERDPRKGCRPQGLNFVPLLQPKPPLGKVLTNRKK